MLWSHMDEFLIRVFLLFHSYQFGILSSYPYASQPHNLYVYYIWQLIHSPDEEMHPHLNYEFVEK